MQPCRQSPTPRRSFGGEHIGRTLGSRRHAAGIAARGIPAPNITMDRSRRVEADLQTCRLESRRAPAAATDLNLENASFGATCVFRAKTARSRDINRLDDVSDTTEPKGSRISQNFLYLGRAESF